MCHPERSVLLFLGLVQEQTGEMAEERAQRDERRRAGRGGLQVRL